MKFCVFFKFLSTPIIPTFRKKNICKIRKKKYLRNNKKEIFANLRNKKHSRDEKPAKLSLNCGVQTGKTKLRKLYFHLLSH